MSRQSWIAIAGALAFGAGCATQAVRTQGQASAPRPATGATEIAELTYGVSLADLIAQGSAYGVIRFPQGAERQRPRMVWSRYEDKRVCFTGYAVNYSTGGVAVPIEGSRDPEDSVLTSTGIAIKRTTPDRAWEAESYPTTWTEKDENGFPEAISGTVTIVGGETCFDTPGPLITPETAWIAFRVQTRNAFGKTGLNEFRFNLTGSAAPSSPPRDAVPEPRPARTAPTELVGAGEVTVVGRLKGKAHKRVSQGRIRIREKTATTGEVELFDGVMTCTVEAVFKGDQLVIEKQRCPEEKGVTISGIVVPGSGTIQVALQVTVPTGTLNQSWIMQPASK